MRKHLHRNTPKLNIPICIAAVLFCLTLFSTYFVSGLYARYTSSRRNGGSARVAVFSVKGEGVLSKPIAAELVPGEIVSNNLIIIENDSEVAVEYTITVTNVTENLPLMFRLIKSGTSSDESDEQDWVPKYESSSPQQIPCKSTENYTLEIKSELNGLDDSDIDLDLIGRVDYITVTVTATQVD